MAYVLKSNVAVSDPTGRFPYLTEYGVCGRDLALYFKAMKTAGHTMSQAHFDAYNAYINGLIADGTWSNVKEIYPLYGKTLSQVSLKLKSAVAPVSLVSVNGLAINSFETDGGGLVLGTTDRGYADMNSPAFNTGMVSGDLTSTWGGHHYIDASAIPYVTNAEVRVMYGAYLDSPAGHKLINSLRQIGSAATPSLQMFNASPGLATAAAPTPLKGLASYVTTDTTQTFKLNNSLLGSVTSSLYNASAAKTNPLWLLAQYPLSGSAGNPTQGFNGKMRFSVITNGLISDALQTSFYTKTMTLITALGKAF